MPQARVDLDAMIPREDFAIAAESYTLDLMKDFQVQYLAKESPVRRLLRKPDFQRETNQWRPEQVVMFIESFVNGEVVPSLILWKAPRFIFVIDGGHRLSALRAWMEDDYGDGGVSLDFYKGEISDSQKRLAKRTRKLVEARVGRYATLREQVDNKGVSEQTRRRAETLATRGLSLQWIQGDASVAETSFFKINSQGTALDDTETMLIKNRKKPIAIGARAIRRGGTGHKYWSDFDDEHQQAVEAVTQEFYERIFKPEAETPLKTLELPLGGSASPVDADSLLIDFLGIAGSREAGGKALAKYDDDDTGSETVRVLKNALQVLNRMSGNREASLGLHPAVYFYNERGKHSKFLFLGMVSLIQEKLRHNNSQWFRDFTKARMALESFLIDNKSIIARVLQNLTRGQRIPKMKLMFEYLVKELRSGGIVKVESVLGAIGVQGKIVDISVTYAGTRITSETKTEKYLKDALEAALKCPICQGRLDPSKSVSYDHVVPVRDGGTGVLSNTQLVHPYCNTGIKN